jgi:hypothetical protein
MFKLQSYKKIGAFWLATGLVFLCSIAFAGSKYNSQTGAKDFCLTVETEAGDVVNDKCIPIKVTNGYFTNEGTFYLLRSQASMTSGSTSMTTATTSVPTSYNFVKKAIALDPAFQAGTLANGVPGQILTIQITEVQTGGHFTLTPSTKTGFTSLYFDTVGDQVSLLYIDDVVGWIRLNIDSVQSLP